MQRRALAVLISLGVCTLVWTTSVRAEPAYLATLAREIAALRAQPDLPGDAAEPLSMAARAHARARALEAAADTEAAARAFGIARAAVTLATRRLALARERADLRVAQHERSAAEARLARAQQALEVERKRLAELTPAPVGGAP